jgi:hypothetical protein
LSDVHDVEHDFRIHNAYVAFSAEVARLALLAPVAFSFLAGGASNLRSVITRRLSARNG